MKRVQIRDIGLKVNTILNYKYRINNYISFGNTTIVYLACDQSTNKEILIKELCPYRIVNRDLDGKTLVLVNNLIENEYEQIKSSFDKEIQILNKLSQKKYGLSNKIPQYIDDFNENGTRYLVMGYYSGKDLRERLIRGEHFDFSKVAYELTDIVCKVHKAGIIHKDIKLSNILVRNDGRIVLLDFGSSCCIDDTDTFMKYISNGYSAPELYEDNEATIEADIYSLGVVMYQMLTGILPVIPEQDSEGIRNISEYINIPWILSWAIMKMLDKNPEHRLKHLGVLKLLVR